ncbi:MAG: hypothetical protein WC516_08980 [Patescibacteria group bacterium]|jgi:hypothetical protein
MVDAMGKVLVQVSDNGYQGDTRVLLELDGKFGVLIFGWGSCSGCDALQACESWDDLSDLFDRLQTQVKWFDSAEETFRYFMGHDWEGDYSWHSDEIQRFISECKEKLAELIGEEDPEVALQKRDDEEEDASLKMYVCFPTTLLALWYRWLQASERHCLWFVSRMRLLMTTSRILSRSW